MELGLPHGLPPATGRAPESIQKGVRGFLRYHAFRQLGASFGALTLAFLFGVVVVVLATNDEGSALTAENPERLLWMVPALFAIGVGGGVFVVFGLGLGLDLLPRRLLGILFLWGVWSYSLALLVPLSIVLQVLGVVDRPESEQGWFGTLVIFVVSLFAFFILISAWRLGWWLLTASREQFLGARGWRPGVAPLSALFRYVGLPPFLAQIRRGWLALLLLHFLIAVVNSSLIAWLAIPVFFVTDEEPPPIVYALGAMILVQLFGAGRWLQRRAEAMLIRRYQGVREWDARPPVLFLRRFDDDAKKLSSVLSLDPVVHWTGQDRALSFDELLLENASAYGPVVAIGDPRDPVPPLGAARIFVEGAGEEWKDVVRALAEAANVIVMCVSDTEGVRWELALVGLASIRHKVVLLADPDRDPLTNWQMFVSVAPELEGYTLDLEDEIIAAFRDPEHGWRLLVARDPGLPAFTIALNIALQRLRGMRPSQRRPPTAGAVR